MPDTKAEIAAIILANMSALTLTLALLDADVFEPAEVAELAPLPDKFVDEAAAADCFALAPALTLVLDTAPAVTLLARPAAALNAAPTEPFSIDPPLALDATLTAVC